MLLNLMLILNLANIQPESAFTGLNNCVDSSVGAVFNQRCIGYQDWYIYLASNERSSTLAYSDRGIAAQYAQRPLRSALSQSFDNTIEWRLDETGAAYATIHRWQSIARVKDTHSGQLTDEYEPYSEEFIVTALLADGEVGACHIAYIDAVEVRQAVELARIVADIWAPKAKCDDQAPLVIDAAAADYLFAEDAKGDSE